MIFLGSPGIIVNCLKTKEIVLFHRVMSSHLIHVQLRSYKTFAWPFYEEEWLLFKVVWCNLQVLQHKCLKKGSRLLSKTQRWVTSWGFISSGIKTTGTHRFRVKTLLDKNKLFSDFLLCFLIIWMLLYVCILLSWKVINLLNKLAEQRFHAKVIVYQLCNLGKTIGSMIKMCSIFFDILE